MSKKVQVEVNFDREHKYIQKSGTGDLSLTVGVNLAVHCYGLMVTNGLYSDLDGTEYIVLTIEMCNAAHRLLIENEEAFMDEVFGAGFNEKYGITHLKVTDYDEVMKQMHRTLIEEAW